MTKIIQKKEDLQKKKLKRKIGKRTPEDTRNNTETPQIDPEVN